MWVALSDERMGLSFTIAAGPRQRSFSGPSPVELVTIFYCLRFETSLFFAFYDSQGYGGGIRPRLHSGLFLGSNPTRDIDVCVRLFCVCVVLCWIAA
jgi:hypothetical protein